MYVSISRGYEACHGTMNASRSAPGTADSVRHTDRVNARGQTHVSNKHEYNEN